MRVLRWALPFAVAGIFVALGQVRGDEEDIPLDKVPKAVMDAVKAKFPGARMTSAAKEEDAGKVIYEVSLTHEGKKSDVSATADGKIVSVETMIKAADLPTAVAKALEKTYPKAEYKTIEVVQEEGKTFYEVLLETADDKTFEVKLDRDGTTLATEEKKDADEKDEKKKG
jgi:uncharacterized membrane protein YkoI